MELGAPYWYHIVLVVVLLLPSAFWLCVVVSVWVTLASPSMMVYRLVLSLTYVLPKMSSPVVVETLPAPVRLPAYPSSPL